MNDKAKFLVSISGVALSTLLILALLGVYFGIEKQSQTIPLTSGANYWITERGAKNLFNSASFLPAGRQQELKRIKGVKDAVPVIDRTTTVKIKDKDVTTAIVGYDTRTGIGKAGAHYKGAGNVGHHEVIVDRAMAQKHDLKIGDRLHINDVDFKITGLTDQTNDMEFQYVFISFQDAEATLQQPAINYYLINLTVPPSQVRPEISRVLPTGELKTKETVAKGNVDVIRDTFLPVIGLMVFIGLAVGTTVIGLTIYTATAERAKEYGVLKAVGVKNRRLFGIVMRQTLISSVLGFAAGVGLYFLVEHFSFYVVPTISFSLSAGYFGSIFLLSVLAGVVAAFIPLRKINRIDPVEAFTP